MERLYEVSRIGDVNSLKELLRENRDISHEDSVFTSFRRTPLHIAAMLGHVEFAKEILKIKPYFASAVDSQGFTPLHLASTRNDVGMVKVLLEANMDACTVQDQEGRTPLHLAAMKDQVKIMKLLIQEKPRAIHYRMVRNSVTIIHYCVQNNSFKALKYLVEYLVGVDVEDMSQDSISLNSTDDDGNTILHLAAQGKNMKLMRYLLYSYGLRVLEINSLNNDGLKALDMLTQRERTDLEIENDHLIIPRGLRLQREQPGNDNGMPGRVNALMVVATLIAAMAFEGARNPPGGVWQDDSKVSSSTDPIAFTYYLNSVINTSMSDSFGSYLRNAPKSTTSISNSTNTTIISNTNLVEALIDSMATATTGNWSRSVYMSSKAPGIVLDEEKWQSIITNHSKKGGYFPYLIRYAGNPVMVYMDPDGYKSYMIFNAVAFLISLTIILLCGVIHIVGSSFFPVRLLEMLITISIWCMVFSYLIVIQTMIPPFGIKNELLLPVFYSYLGVWGLGGFFCLLSMLKISGLTRYTGIMIYSTLYVLVFFFAPLMLFTWLFS